MSHALCRKPERRDAEIGGTEQHFFHHISFNAIDLPREKNPDPPDSPSFVQERRRDPIEPPVYLLELCCFRHQSTSFIMKCIGSMRAFRCLSAARQSRGIAAGCSSRTAPVEVPSMSGIGGMWKDNVMSKLERCGWNYNQEIGAGDVVESRN